MNVKNAVMVAKEASTAVFTAMAATMIRNADRIILLDQGRIAEAGNHDALLAIPNGRYRELYEKHAGKDMLTDEE